MSRPVLLAAVLLMLAVLGAAVVLLQLQIKRQKRLAARLLAIREGEATVSRVHAGGAARHGAAAAISGLGTMVTRSGLLPRATVQQMQEQLSGAGFRSGSALGLFIGVKLILLAALPLAAWILLPSLHLAPLTQDVGIAAAAIVGLLAPDWWLTHYRSVYRKAVATGLPDALDMLVICTEAGLGLEPALHRVGHEIRHAHPQIAAEIARTVVELRVVPEGRIALIDMGERNGVESLKRVASTLAQTMQYGTPLGQALRVLAAEMRNEKMLEFEARAARLPVLLTLPMIVFILPCIFMVIGGPAMVQVMHTFFR